MGHPWASMGILAFPVRQTPHRFTLGRWDPTLRACAKSSRGVNSCQSKLHIIINCIYIYIHILFLYIGLSALRDAVSLLTWREWIEIGTKPICKAQWADIGEGRWTWTWRMVLPPKSTVCKNTNNIALNWPILAHDHIVWDMYQGAILLAHQTIRPSRFLGQITQLRGIEGKVKVGYKWKLQTPSIHNVFPSICFYFLQESTNLVPLGPRPEPTPLRGRRWNCSQSTRSKRQRTSPGRLVGFRYGKYM